ncbi:MAG: hypothetical protein ABIJ96_09895 [Elusimicrobiota bacterium]
MRDAMKRAALPFCLAVIMPHGASAAAMQAMRGNAHEAIAALQVGLKDGASLEDSSGAGFKAQQALLGRGSGGVSVCGAACVAAAEKASAENVPALTAEEYAPEHLRPATAVPPPAVQPEKPSGAVTTLLRKAAGFAGKTVDRISKMNKAGKVALLVGLLVVEAAVIIWPTPAITVAVTGLGVLGLFGTVRELIGMFRRGRL